MSKSDLAALAAQALANGARVTRVDAGARAYGDMTAREWRKVAMGEAAPMSDAQRQEQDDFKAYASYERKQQAAWVKRFA